ncbi:hypothetical protein, partial [Agathobaculum sp.]|uniref:hypothetical protein n=1 Tax=Agathobaculum sp. TaxID=2048138 RepID=UPI003A92E71A
VELWYIKNKCLQSVWECAVPFAAKTDRILHMWIKTDGIAWSAFSEKRKRHPRTYNKQQSDKGK